jgi:hypothetical protein
MASLRPLTIVTAVLAVLGFLGLRLIPDLLAADALASDAGTFVETPCTKVIPNAERRTSRHDVWYRPILACEYVVDGHTHWVDSQNPQLDLAISRSAVGARKRVLDYASAHPQHAYYDPNDPARAVTSRYVVVDRSNWLFVIGGAICTFSALVLFVVIVAGAARERRRVLRARDDFPTARLREH